MSIKRPTYVEVFEFVLKDVNEVLHELMFGNDTINSIITEQLIELEVEKKTSFTKEMIKCIMNYSENDIHSWYEHFKGHLMQGQFERLQNEIIYVHMKNMIREILDTSYHNCSPNT